MVLLKIALFVVYLLVATNCNVIFDMSLVPDDCIKNRAVSADYTPLGKIVNIGNLPVYEYDAPNNNNSKRMIIGAYDIYVFAYSNIMQVMDQMAIQNDGFRAVLPDFFRGDSNNPDREPTTPPWIQQVGDWETIVKPDLINVVRHYRSEGVEEFAIMGWCWSGKVATNIAKELSDDFKASALIHPSSVTTDEGQDVKIPMYLMPTSNDLDMSSFYEVLQGKFGNNGGHRRFVDMTHGFAGARGNFSDSLIQERVNEVITTLGAFFDQNLNRTITTGNNSPSVQPGHGHFLIMTLIISVFIISRR